MGRRIIDAACICGRATNLKQGFCLTWSSSPPVVTRRSARVVRRDDDDRQPLAARVHAAEDDEGDAEGAEDGVFEGDADGERVANDDGGWLAVLATTATRRGAPRASARAPRTARAWVEGAEGADDGEDGVRVCAEVGASATSASGSSAKYRGSGRARPSRGACAGSP